MAFDVTDFITALVVHFGEPKFDVADAEKKKAYFQWLKDMSHNLGGFPGGTLEKAAEIIIATRKYRSFPMLFECKEACVDAREWLQSQQKVFDDGRKPKILPQWSPSRFDTADQLVMCSIGKTAAKEGWILSLHDFCRNTLSLPTTDAEIACCKASAKEFDASYAMWICGEYSKDPGLKATYVQLGTSMLARREQLRSMVLDGVVR